jgi:hypothetical protein
VSGYIADEIRRAVDLDAHQQAIRLLELAVIVERMERQLDNLADEEREDAHSLSGLIARCNR